MIAAAVWLSAAGTAAAETKPVPPPAPAPPSDGDQLPPAIANDHRIASTGWFAEGGLGVTAFLPSAADDAKIGPTMNLRFGRDLFSWLSVGIFVAASSHEATVPPPPTGEWFQLYRGGGDVRLGGRFNKLSLFVEGGLGVGYISSNILDKVMITKPGSHASFAVQAGAGLEYQLENRHYGLGLAADGAIEPSFASVKSVDGRLYLRYTY